MTEVLAAQPPDFQAKERGMNGTHEPQAGVRESAEARRRDCREPSRGLPRGWDLDAVQARWQVLSQTPELQAELADSSTLARLGRYRLNVENIIGSVRVPLGAAGPLRVNGRFARGDYFIPLATSEAALVASYNRGAQMLTQAGGCRAAVLKEGIRRAPGFLFRDLNEVEQFLAWLPAQLERLKRVVQSTTAHGRLSRMDLTVEGNHVYAGLEFFCGDAAGQNMITIAAEAVCDFIQANSPVKPEECYVEANFSGDKKACAQSFQTVRGRRACAEAVLPAAAIEEWLHTTPAKMARCWGAGAMGGVLSGTIGVQGHFANGLAALFIACGQDVACVAEASVGVTRFEVTSQGDLYSCVTLPSLVVGTVGGGTGLPSQNACLELMGLAGPGHANAFAEVCAGVCLAGELSIVGALCSGEFTRAHLRLARDRNALVPEGERSDG